MLYLRTHLQEGVRPGIDLVTYIIYTAHTCRKVRGLGVDLVENKVAALQTNNKKNSQKKFECMYVCMYACIYVCIQDLCLHLPEASTHIILHALRALECLKYVLKIKTKK